MDDQTFKVAVATSDGINVDSHFGHVNEFTIYEVDAITGDGEPVEFRKIEQNACKNATCGGEAFEHIAERLSDVEYVLAAKIGPHAVQSLSRRNIVALDVCVPIEEALHKVRDFRDRKKKIQERAKSILLQNGIEE